MTTMVHLNIIRERDNSIILSKQVCSSYATLGQDGTWVGILVENLIQKSILIGTIVSHIWASPLVEERHAGSHLS